MITLATFTIAASAVSLLLLVTQFLESTPEGYEDDRGFHFGRAPGQTNVGTPGQKARRARDVRATLGF